MKQLYFSSITAFSYAVSYLHFWSLKKYLREIPYSQSISLIITSPVKTLKLKLYKSHLFTSTQHRPDSWLQHMKGVLRSMALEYIHHFSLPGPKFFPLGIEGSAQGTRLLLSFQREEKESPVFGYKASKDRQQLGEQSP